MRALEAKDVVDEFEKLIDELVDPVLLKNSSNAAILVPEKAWAEMQQKIETISDS